MSGWIIDDGSQDEVPEAYACIARDFESLVKDREYTKSSKNCYNNIICSISYDFDGLYMIYIIGAMKNGQEYVIIMKQGKEVIFHLFRYDIKILKDFLNIAS